ncbi:glycerol-3-phosphate dehydrogenase [Chachezhania sediminis]|uniref:glycerol-3-phosphate dehydrogenase n=1 Tax=Chachezhania sediminis TaxID=2599291 RepID=UPI001E61F447|nr:glycerol-3-phosphate dehydrogenase [Chachezhania sediminis]
MSDDGGISDLFVIGGGINGCGIARDAAGRGLSVVLAEKGDLASATSSASTKLFHGGLRYLEYFEFRLVKEALAEREVLLRAMPHISWPMRFVLPLSPDMRFPADTPAAKVLSRTLPWLKGRRPAWMIRAGLAAYDRLGGRQILPGTKKLDLDNDPAGQALKPGFHAAFEYSDCWVQDSRLVVLNARDAEARGATILPRTTVLSAEPRAGLWRLRVRNAQGKEETRVARVLVNAAGPWVGDVATGIVRSNSPAKVRLVRGSHIVTRRLFDHDRAYFLQGPDGRIVFAIPYEDDFTLIGTTDADHTDPDIRPECTPEEEAYLCRFVSDYFKVPVTEADIVWRYSGVRPLYDDGARSATAATRDYVLNLERTGGAAVLHVFGGKITTYRRLAEHALDKIAGVLDHTGTAWTAGAALPGGDFPVGDVADQIATLQSAYPFLDAGWARRLFRAYGTEAHAILGEAQSPGDLGQDFGATLTGREVAWLMDREYARTVEDVLWRRSKLGLRLGPDKVALLRSWMKARSAG